MKIRNVFLVVVCIISILIVKNAVSVNAVEFGGIETIGTTETSPEFNLEVNSTCSEHDFFYQVSARDDGGFIVCYRQTSSIPATNKFDMAYIDVFDEEGTFLYELSFYTLEDFVAEYTYESINIYFYNSIISYNAITRDVSAYRIQDEAALQCGLFDRLRATEFDSGRWHYSCKKSFHGYTVLTRECEDDRQVLISLPGTGYSILNTVVPSISLGAVFVALFAFIRKVRKKRSSVDSAE